MKKRGVRNAERGVKKKKFKVGAMVRMKNIPDVIGKLIYFNQLQVQVLINGTFGGVYCLGLKCFWEPL
jgi:hypothetical protein